MFWGRGRVQAALAFGLLASCVVMAGCTSQTAKQRPVSASPQPGDVVVSGRFLTATGAPATGRPVVATRVNRVRDVFADLFTFSFTAGFATVGCFDSAHPALETCHTNGFRAATDKNGRFGMRLRRGDVRSGSTGGLRDLSVATGTPPAKGEISGPRVAVVVRPDVAAVTVPTVRLWDGAVRTRSDEQRVDVSWQQAPDASSSYTAHIDDTSRHLQMTAPAIGTASAFDARYVEDATTVVSVAASGHASTGEPVQWQSGGVRLLPTAGAPVSRHQRCSVQLDGAASQPAGACWLDDGDFGTNDPTSHATPVHAITLDLSTPQQLSLLVLRLGSSAPLAVTVDASANGRTWTPVGKTSVAGQPSQPVPLVPPPDVTARFVRVTADDTAGRTDLAGLAELSVWPGQPAAPVGTPTKTSATTPHDSHHTSHRGWFIALAAVIIAAILAAAGYLLGRRRVHTNG